MAAPGQDSAVVRLIAALRPFYVIVSGTTSASANTAATLAHTLQDDKGRALVPSAVILIKTNNVVGGLFNNVAGNTSGVIDVRTDTAAALNYVAILLP